jgi:hypothetical protein
MLRAAEFLPPSPTEGLCVPCTQAVPEDIERPNDMRARVRDATTAAAINILVSTGATSLKGYPDSRKVRAWFDPLRRAENDLWVCAKVPWWVAELEALTPYDGALGVMPAGISELLAHTWTRCQGWNKCGLTEIGERHRAPQSAPGLCCARCSPNLTDEV